MKTRNRRYRRDHNMGGDDWAIGDPIPEGQSWKTLKRDAWANNTRIVRGKGRTIYSRRSKKRGEAT